ncbi:MAG TPA: DUF6259 domain-containing protein [Gaiellaceae bacterium]|nr:DUF6259 domain-containing protein [Gaiellaceae bacterium]
MKRGLAAISLGIACLLGVGAAAGGLTAKPKPKKKKPKVTLPAIRLATKDPSVLVLTAPGYRLILAKENGEILELLDRRTGEKVVRGQNGCLWAAKQTTGVSAGGCAFNRTGEDRFTFRWSQLGTTLTMRYDSSAGGPGVDAEVTLAARSASFDLQLKLDSDVEYPLSAVLFPADLYVSADDVRAGYMPTFLPGTRFLPGFFKGPRKNVETYPSRWAFADFMAADVGRSHVAVYSVNPATRPVAPVDLGFVRGGEASACGGPSFCATHVFQTWVAKGSGWTSPVVRVRPGGSIEQSLAAYRRDNGIADYPSLADKLGARLDTLARAPLVKADLWKGLPEFRQWGPYLASMPRPALVHPVAFQSGGFDEAHPDFLPPDPRWGSTDDFNAMAATARSLGQLVMPYLNVSWWDTQAPSVQSLPSSVEPKDIAVQNLRGNPVTEQFGDKDGYIVSPHVLPVRTRIDGVFDEWRTQAPADCLFFDQIGARPWRRDFNPAAPTPLAYYDGWLSLFKPYASRCVMAEDGWDRIAATFSGFHGGVLQMSRQFEWPNDRWGQGNWEPYPLAGFLFQDKVLMYQHDLYEPTMTNDPETLLFNVAFGLVLSYAWEGESLTSPWATLVGQVQRTLGPHYAGKRVVSFREVAPNVTETVFEGGYRVHANWGKGAVTVDGQLLAPSGFLARAAGGEVLASALGFAWGGVSFPGGAR